MRTELKLLRVKNHLTQGGFAERVGVSRIAYSFIENGKRQGSENFWGSVQKEFSVPDEKMYSLMKNEEIENGE